MVFVVFSSPALFNAYARWYQPAPVKLPPNTEYSFAIVAGGFGSVGADGDGYFNSASDRFLQAVRLYKTGAVKGILISGGNSKKNDAGFQEGRWAKGQMVQFGVPASAILVEDRSDNTRENATNSKKILDSVRAKPPYLLITSAFHMPRAQRLYKQTGLDIIPYPCNYTEGRGPFTLSDLIPQVSLLSSWSKYIKESVWMVVRG